MGTKIWPLRYSKNFVQQYNQAIIYCLITSLQFLMKIFENVNGTMNVLEDDLCECSAPVHPGVRQELTCSFPFQKYEGAVDLLGTDEWKTGQAIRIFLARENFMR